MHAPARFCSRCSHLEPCPTHGAAAREKQRGSSAARGYDAAWYAARSAWLRGEDVHDPAARVAAIMERRYCADPYGVHGRQRVPMYALDHIVPHRGDWRLFWDRANWQPLCRACHSRKTAEEVGLGG